MIIFKMAIKAKEIIQEMTEASLSRTASLSLKKGRLSILEKKPLYAHKIIF